MELTKEGIVRTEEINGTLIIHFQSGKIREETVVHRFLEELGNQMDSENGSKILINMENLEYLSSAGLGVQDV